MDAACRKILINFVIEADITYILLDIEGFQSIKRSIILQTNSAHCKDRHREISLVTVMAGGRHLVEDLWSMGRGKWVSKSREWPYPIRTAIVKRE